MNYKFAAKRQGNAVRIMLKKLKKHFSKIQPFYRREKEEYHNENPDTTEDFQYHFL
jgi:hypothetical protein